jgi:predicted nucleotidyltransferase
MKLEAFVEKIESALGESLTSVILYGSAAAGDHVAKKSDYNLLVVASALGLKELKAIASVTGAWTRAGNPPPLLFTRDRLQKSADTFPIELLDIKQAHRILSGEDVVSDIEVSDENLRLELEHELKGKLIQLREGYLMTGGKPRQVTSLMTNSISTFLVLFRGALRLYSGSEVPVLKRDALQALSEHIEIDQAVFLEIDSLRQGEVKSKDIDADALFDRYVNEVERVVDAVDDFIHQKNGGSGNEGT